MKLLISIFFIGTAILGLAAAGSSQEKKTATETRVESHIYEPARLEPTDERVNNLNAPAGFRIAKYAQLSNPRMIAVADDGTVYVTQREPGTLVMLRDTDKDGIADVQRVVAEKPMLHGLAIRNGRMYLVAVKELFAADIKPDGTLGPLSTIVTDLPDGGQHPNRTLGFGPDGLLYITVGSTCNECKETNPESATVLRMKPDGTGREIFASGLRNTIGFGWHPVSRRMFGMDHGIDWLGDNQQAEELNELTEKARYGWPFVYADGKLNPHNEPPQEYTQEMWKGMSKEPLLLATPHSAPMQMVFYTGNQFPAEYRNDAFVAMRGSWNRKPPSGYEVLRIRFDQSGTPLKVEPFLTGFLVKGGAAEGKDGHFGRLAGLAVARDGSLLVGDDTNNILYRIWHEPNPVRAARAPEQAFPNAIALTLPEAQSAGTLSIRSTDFKANDAIPEQHSAYHQGMSPAFAWSGVPKEAKSLVLMMEDPDAFSPKPVVHWLAINLPPTLSELPAGLPQTERLDQAGGALQGANQMSKPGYYGPKPPAGDPPHKYHFQLFALDTTLTLPSGFNRQAVLKAMKGHVLAKGELVGTYQHRQSEPKK